MGALDHHSENAPRTGRPPVVPVALNRKPGLPKGTSPIIPPQSPHSKHGPQAARAPQKRCHASPFLRLNPPHVASPRREPSFLVVRKAGDVVWLKRDAGKADPSDSPLRFELYSLRLELYSLRLELYSLLAEVYQ